MLNLSKYVSPTTGWRLLESVKFIQSLQPKANKLGWNLSLGGGVLNKGYSNKDLDIIATPRQAGKFMSSPSLNSLIKLEFKDFKHVKIRACWHNGVCLEFNYRGKRVDFLVFNVKNFEEELS